MDVVGQEATLFLPLVAIKSFKLNMLQKYFCFQIFNKIVQVFSTSPHPIHQKLITLGKNNVIHLVQPRNYTYIDTVFTSLQLVCNENSPCQSTNSPNFIPWDSSDTCRIISELQQNNIRTRTWLFFSRGRVQQNGYFGIF